MDFLDEFLCCSTTCGYTKRKSIVFIQRLVCGDERKCPGFANLTATTPNLFSVWCKDELTLIWKSKVKDVHSRLNPLANRICSLSKPRLYSHLRKFQIGFVAHTRALCLYDPKYSGLFEISSVLTLS